MDHPCHKCNQAVEDGVAFCSNCGAPQIRVAMPEVVPVLMDTAGVADPHGHLASSSVIPALALPVQWSYALRPCALAAGVAVLFTLLGLKPLVTMLGGGVLAVTFYRYRNPLTSIRPGVGARLGALAGLLGFGISTVLGAFFVALFNKGAELRSLIQEGIQQSAARYSGPEYQSALDFMRSPAGMAFMMVFGLIFLLVSFVALSAIGGAVAAALLGRRDRQ